MLDIQIKNRHGAKELVLIGKLDAASAIKAESVLLKEIFNAAEPIIGINLSHLSLIDSSGLGVFIRIHKSYDIKNKKIQIFANNVNILSIIKMARLETLWKIVDEQTFNSNYPPKEDTESNY